MNPDLFALLTAVAAGDALALPQRPVVRTRIAASTAFGLASLSGAVYATGFPPLSWTIAPWLALVPLLVACAALSPLRAAMAGMCWAVTAAIGVAWFLPGMLSGYFGLSPVPSWLATVAVVGGLHGLSVSAYAAWVAWLVRRRAANPVLLAGGWLVCEFARANGGLSSPWALAAYSQLRWTPMIQIADVAGPYGIGLLIAGVNACAAASMVPALRGRRPVLATVTIGAAVLGALLYGEWRLGQSVGDGEPVRVAVVQGGLSSTENASRYVAMTTVVQADLIVWPEHAIAAYLEEPSTERDAVLGITSGGRTDLVLGAPHYEPSASGTRYHNSAYLVRDGRIAGRYDKTRLVPFAETTTYTPGPGTFVLPATALRVGVLLCVEGMFPDLVRQATGQGAELLLNLSNDGWFGHPVPARHQLEIATLRAVESRRYLVRAAATGFSAVIDPYGRTLTESGFDTREVLTATVRASHVRTPYQRWGDAFAWVVIAAVVGASLRSLLVRKPSNRRRLA
ncbi:MAG TPA: apolipoprotein N-acyltransferase [Candidatus Binatia bacterium]|jgi:apolipoprotein N-acyltransferase|nr:apolipoprotein N-acyltransferase [Candidatus Binatia bacterium]